MKRFLLSQIAIFFSVFIPVKLIGLDYNGVDWEYSLAYGALIILPLIKCRSWQQLVCLLSVLAAWGYGRYIELGADPSNIELIPYIYAAIAVICALNERWGMMLFAGLTSLYAVRLTGVDVSYWQQGLFNLFAAGLCMFPDLRMPDATEEKPKDSEHHEERWAA